MRTQSYNKKNPQSAIPAPDTDGLGIPGARSSQAPARPDGLRVIVGCQRVAYSAFTVSAATIVVGALLGVSPGKLAAVGATSLIFLLTGTFLWSWGFALAYDLHTDDEDDGGGRGGQTGSPDPRPGPTIDWDQFEADFQAWARTRELIRA